MKRYIFIILYVFFTFFIFSSDSKSDWLKVNKFRWSDEHFEYFVGQSDFNKDETAAQNTAILNAKNLLSEEILTFIKSEFIESLDTKTIKTNKEFMKEFIEEKNGVVNEEYLSSKTEEIKKEYIEKISKTIESKTVAMFEGIKVIPLKLEDKGFGKNKQFKYKALIKLTKDEYKDVLSKPKKEESLKLKEIQKIIDESKNLFNNAKIPESISNLETSFKKINDLVFFTEERTTVVNSMYDLSFLILNSLIIETKLLPIENNTKGVFRKSEQITFKSNGKPIKGLKVDITENKNFVKSDFNKYTTEEGVVLLDITQCLKYGSFSIFLGIDSIIEIFRTKGVSVNLEGQSTGEKNFSVTIEHSILEDTQKTQLKNNYFDQQISGFLIEKNIKTSDLDSNNKDIQNILSNNNKSKDFYQNIGMFAGSRYVITGSATCEILNEGDGLFSGKSKIFLIIFDSFENKQIANTKFELTKKILGKSKESIAEGAFKELRGQVIRFIDKEILTKIQ